MEKASWRGVHPIASLDGSSPIEFHIVSSQEDYLDLNDASLYVKMKIVKADGSAVDPKTHNPFTPNLALSSLFSDVSLFLNGTLCEGGHHLYPYKAMLTSLLQFD